MTASFRLLVTLVLVTSGLVGVVVEQPGWLQSMGRPARTPTMRLVEPPPEQIVILNWRIKAKTGVVARMRAGELSLFEAAAWFRAINAEPPEHPDRNVRTLPGDSENEKTCRQVIAWIGGHMGGRRASEGEIKAAERELEEELDWHLAEHGEVVLPGWE